MVNFQRCTSVRLCGQKQEPIAITLKYQTSHRIQSVKITIAFLQLLQHDYNFQTPDLPDKS